MPVQNFLPQNPAHFVQLLENRVMRPGFSPYPQALSKNGIVFGPKPRDLAALSPLVPIDGSPADITRSQSLKKYRGSVEGIELVESARDMTRRMFADGTFLGPLSGLERELDERPLAAFEKARLGETDFSKFREGFAHRMSLFGKKSVREIVKEARERNPHPPKELCELALDFTLAAELNLSDKPAAIERFFLSGVLLGTASNLLMGTAHFKDTARLASQMFMKSADMLLHVWPAAAVGEFALMHAQTAAEKDKLGADVSGMWLFAAFDFKQDARSWDICLLRGLTIAFGTGAWKNASKFYAAKADSRPSTQAADINNLRSAWALARSKPWETDWQNGWNSIASRLYKVFEPHVSGSGCIKTPDGFEGLEHLLTAATNWRLGRV